MQSVIRRIWLGYPIPYSVSIWGIAEENRKTLQLKCPIKSIEETSPDDFTVSDLLEQCLIDLRSDLSLTKQIPATGITTYLSKDAKSVISVKLDPRFQGNRYVKWSYDSVNKVVSLRYFPASIKYSVAVTTSNVDDLVGDPLIYLISYVHWKMSEREHTILSAVTLNADNGEIDLTALKEFSDKNRENYMSMKPEILMYSASS